MVVGLGSFLEGKGSLRTSWLDTTDGPMKSGQEQEVEGRADAQQQAKQRSDEMAQAMVQLNCPSHMPCRLHHRHKRPPSPGTDRSREQLRSTPSSKTNKPWTAGNHLRADEPSQGTTSAKGENAKYTSPKENYTSQVKDTFSRAANLVRESLEVEGVVYFDANFGSQQVSVNDPKSDHESSLESSSSESELKFGKDLKLSELSQSLAESLGKETLNPCSILGFATSNASSINDESMGDARIALSESFLGGLLRRYPRGKIFNFGEDGSMSSNDSSDGVFKDFSVRGKKFKRTRRSVLRQDAMALLKVAPNSRCIVFSPVWDSHKSRWYAGTLAWTRAPRRVFTHDDDLSFCMAFGNSIMAEVHRLGALLVEQAKSDLLAGISHEIRTPLHGILGTVDLLNETVMDALQRGLVHTIASCANTLLGSINQLLEFSNINDLQSTPKTTASSFNCSSLKEGNPWQAKRIDAVSSVQVDVTVEDAIDTVFAGYSFFNGSRFPLRGVTNANFDSGKPATLPGGVRLILDIDSTSTWSFVTNAGVWHVIITNILGNALKYTQQGYICVSLKATPVRFGEMEEAMRSKVTMTIKDTGRGMTPEFLQNGFFSPFSQENDMSPGNGLGASITQQTVSALGGDIKVHSQKHVGTQVMIFLTLDDVSHPSSTSGLVDNTDSYSVASTKALVYQKTIGILGLGTSEPDTTLSSSLHKLCDEWFQMEVCLISPSHTQFPHCDFYIAPHEYLDMGNLEIQSIAPDKSARFPSPIIVICSSPRVAHSLFLAAQRRGDSDVLEFVTQPCGPRKLAKALENCIKRQQRRVAGSGYRQEPLTEALMAPTFGTLESQNLPAPNVELRTHPSSQSKEVTNYSASTQAQGYTDAPGQAKSLPDDNCSLVSPTALCTPEAEHPPPELNDSQSSAQPNSPTILLVDDNDINLKLLVAFMKKLRYKYVTAQNGQEAVDSFKENHSQISIVLMDISMPVMDGLESTRQIRAFEKTLEKHDRATIIALTSVAQVEIQRDAMGSGMDLFLTKPVRLDTIARIIKNGSRVNLDSVPNWEYGVAH